MCFLEKNQINLKDQENHKNIIHKKIKMKYLTLLFISSILLFSCNETANKAVEERTEAIESEAEAAFEKFGKEITADGAIETPELFAQLETEDSVFVKVNTSVSQVCKKKGCWMMVPLNEETEMRVKFKDYDFFVPLNCEGRTTVIEGWAFKNEISAATLRHYAADAGATEEEIDAITEPEVEYTFMADGVLMN